MKPTILVSQVMQDGLLANPRNRLTNVASNELVVVLSLLQDFAQMMLLMIGSFYTAHLSPPDRPTPLSLRKTTSTPPPSLFGHPKSRSSSRFLVGSFSRIVSTPSTISSRRRSLMILFALDVMHRWRMLLTCLSMACLQFRPGMPYSSPHHSRLLQFGI